MRSAKQFRDDVEVPTQGEDSRSIHAMRSGQINYSNGSRDTEGN
jgi:hypothetical protein